MAAGHVVLLSQLKLLLSNTPHPHGITCYMPRLDGVQLLAQEPSVSPAKLQLLAEMCEIRNVQLPEHHAVQASVQAAASAAHPRGACDEHYTQKHLPLAKSC